MDEDWARFPQQHDLQNRGNVGSIAHFPNDTATDTGKRHALGQ